MPNPPIVIDVPFRVRYAETDAQQIVHHSSYVIYFEEARSEYIRQRGISYAEMEKVGYFMVVTDITIRYHQAARYDNLLMVRVWIEEQRSRSITFGYEVLNAETSEKLATGTSKHLFVNHDGSVVKIPETWHNWIS